MQDLHSLEAKKCNTDLFDKVLPISTKHKILGGNIMALKKRLFTKRRTFASAGRPSPREVKSQVAQLESNQPGTRKDVKLNMDKKLN